MPFQYTFRADDITTWDVDTRDLVENRDRELELYSTTIDTSFLNLNASNLTSGTVLSARMTGAYTGITGLGTLTSLTIDGPTSPSIFFGDWNQDNNWAGIRGSFGYLLTGSSGAGNAGIYLRTESTANPVYIGSNNTNTLRVDDTSATLTGTMNATTFSGSGASLTSLPAGQLTGTVASARITGAYSGVTDVGTLGSLTVTNDLTVDTNTLRVDSTNNRVGINVTSPTSNLDIVGNQVIRAAATQDGIQLAGRAGGTTSLSSKFIPATLTTNRTLTLPDVDGTLITTGNLSSITAVGTLASGSIPASLLTGTTLPATIVTSSLTSVGTLTALTASGQIQTTGGNFVASNPTTGSGNAANWILAFSVYSLVRNTSTKADKENIQSLNNIVTPNMIDDIDISLWNRKTAPGIPEIGPMAEDMDAISPFLSTRGMDMDEDGNIISTSPNGINTNSWMSLITIALQDTRKRLQQLENQ
jgi:hypothetical protein